MTFDEGYAELLSLISEEEARGSDVRNEAQTRFDVIDRVLKDVLGWPAESIKVEQHVDNGGYTDYELVDSATIAVVEAKREGVGFTLPHDSAAGACSLVPLVGETKNAALRQALQQVMGYAAQRGVGPCIATNGNQWIAFLGSRSDGVPPLAGRALVYPSLAAIRDNFVVFHNCLSVDGLLRREIYTATSVGVAAPPATLAASILNYPGIKRRNIVQTNLQILGQIMLEDIPQEEQYSDLFLRECYASSGALSSYAEISKELLTSRNAALLAESGAIEQPATVRRGVNPILSDEALAAAASHRPIVLLGGVGSGKSTFIQHLVAVDAQAVFQDAIAVTVDYGRGATFKSPTDFAVSRILEELLDRHNIDVDDASFVEDVYRRDLDRFDRGIAGRLKDVDPKTYALRRLAFLEDLVADRDEHLKRSISRIVRTRRRQIVIFLDNVDQREHSDQNQVFLAANELAATWEATVFVTLRPETYFESQRYGAVSGYHPRVFTISPPRTDVMLQKRVDFALRVLEGGQDVRTTKGGLGVESQSLELFLRVLDANFRGNRGLMALIDNLAGGNMRKALDFVTGFIGSGHVDTQKIIGAEEREPGHYVIPIHEFLRSLMHGDNEYYDPSTSPIPNLFSLERPDRKNHFVLPIALDYILSRGEARDGAGFVELRDVFQHLQDLGYQGDVSAHALSYLGRYRLVEAPRSDADIATADRARITTVGAYCLRNLPRLFTYCDAIIVDTPILDRDVRAQIMDARTMSERVARAMLFRAYLDEAWVQSALARSNWGWSGVSESLGQDIDKVAGRLARLQPRT